MNERLELENLKKRQHYLETQLEVLGRDIQRLETRLEAEQNSVWMPASVEPRLQPANSDYHAPSESVIMPPLPPPIPPGLRMVSIDLQASAEAAAPELAASPPVIPPSLSVPFAEVEAAMAVEGEASPLAAPIVAEENPPAKGSFEMRMGTYWFVRVGIVMLLTSLAFFAKFAYQSFIGNLGPGGKIALLYFAGSALLGTGAWLQRKKEKEALKNFGQVLIAGGLAAVYFTTYAAHYFATVRIIDSPTLAGALLMGWAAFIVWLADWKKSEVLGLFAVALAYYTSVINPIELFTLYSNLLLTLVAVVFLVRNRWAAVSFVSLAATYFSYGFWRFYHTGQPVWQGTLLPHDFWTGNLFLLGYWTLFTAAVFLSRHEMLSGWSRAVFLSANNAAFFAYVAATVPLTYPGSFWKFSLGYGAVLIGLALLARWRLAAEKVALNAYLSQGLLLITLGFMTYFTGPSLALVLAAESVVLLVLGSAGQNLVMKGASLIIAGLAVSIGILEIKSFQTKGLYLGIGLGALMIFNARWSRGPSSEAKTASLPAAYFSALGLLVWLVATWRNTAHENLAPVLAVETLAITASIYALRLRELTVLAQMYLVLGQFSLLWNWIEQRPAPPWWNPVSVIAITLALSHWWQHQKTFFREKKIAQPFQGLYALAIVGVLFCWLNPIFAVPGSRPTWLWLTSALAIGITVYGVLTRAWLLIVSGQIFLAISAVEFVRQMFGSLPPWPVALAPIATLVLLAASARAWLQGKPETEEKVAQPIHQLNLLYRTVALLLTLLWVHKYIPEQNRFWVLVLLGGLLFLVNGWKPNDARLIFSAVLTLAGFVYFWTPGQGESAVSWLNLFAILFVLSQQQIARRWPENFPIKSEAQTPAILLGACSAWLFVSRWVLLKYSGFYLTASWAGLAFLIFAAGLLLKEQIYRWLGLVVLAAAVGRVTLFDVWKLQTLHRVLSFLALGVVLVVLGFIYNKYQEKIRTWL